MNEFEAAVDEFHRHLDTCERCRTRPFDLCQEGATLLKEAGGGVAPHVVSGLYSRRAPCFMRRKGCEAKAAFEITTDSLCIAMCDAHQDEFSDMKGFKKTPLPPTTDT